MKPARPADVTVVLATALVQRRGASYGLASASADEVASRLRLLGFQVTAQQAGAYLRRIAGIDSPPIVAVRDCRPWAGYVVTGFGRTWIENLLGLRLEGEFPHPNEIEGGGER